MNDEFQSQDVIEKIKQTYKPSLVNPILLIFISFTIYGGFWMDLYDGNYQRLGILSIALVLSIFSSGVFVGSYFYQWLNYKKELKEYRKDPDQYKW